MRTIGSLFAGIGGLDAAGGLAGLGVVGWQLDLVGDAVRRRRWPDAQQVVGDVTEVDWRPLSGVDVIVAGFACQDLSIVGDQASKDDLHRGGRTGPTWRGVVSAVRAIQPEVVVLENVPALIGRRAQVEGELPGYGWRWCTITADTVGAPHKRARVFVLGCAVGVDGRRSPTCGRLEVCSGLKRQSGTGQLCWRGTTATTNRRA